MHKKTATGPKVNPLMPGDSSTAVVGRVHFQFNGFLICFVVPSFIIEIQVLHVKSVNPDQAPRSAEFDLGLPVWTCPFNATLGINDIKLFKLLNM